jgi:aminoglycoside 6'-N-acetyltransferase
VTLRPLADADIPELTRIIETPEVARSWDDGAPSIDIFVDPALHGRGIGTEAIRRLAAHLIEERGHHRITIDPAAHNHQAIRAYEKAGFTPVGVMRAYERDMATGEWHDGLLMELVTG